MEFIGQFIPLIIIGAIVYYFFAPRFMAHSAKAKSEGKNLIQSISYTKFMGNGAVLVVLSYVLSNYGPELIMSDGVSFEKIEEVAKLKYYSWGLFFLGVLVFCFGAIKALLDKPEHS